jgi:hypothetical protein
MLTSSITGGPMSGHRQIPMISAAGVALRV